MLVFWQIAAFLGLLALAVAWGNWVWDSHRPIDAPRSLGEVVVHGIGTDEADPTARALALGVAATVAEHYRVVDFINQAASTAGEFLIRARGPAPEPLLLQSGGEGERLDVTVEFAGARLDSKGLMALVQRSRPRRDALALSVSLRRDGEREGAGWQALASASFAENSAYGFQTDAQGSLDEVAQTIGLRFVQAHYATRDPFFAAISRADFVQLWEVRREAAQMALRGIGGDAEDTEALRAEARAAYRRIAHLAERYRRREDVQRLAAYLAQVADTPDLARGHAEAARSAASEESDRAAMAQLIAALDLEIANRRSETETTAVAAAARPAGAPADPLADPLAEALGAVAAANAAVFAELGIDRMIATHPAARRPRIGVVMGTPPESWLARAGVTLVRQGAGKPDPSLGEHSGRMLSILASVAPEAEILVSAVGSLTNAEIDTALAALAPHAADVVYSDFGVPVRASGLEMWQARIVANLSALKGFGGLVVMAAGNDNSEVPAVPAPPGAPAFALVGSTAPADDSLRYSNFGPGVAFAVPGDVTTLEGASRLVRQRGTSMASAVFAAAAARLAAISGDPPDGAALRAALAATARQRDGAALPDFAAAADRIAAGSDG